MLSKADFLLRDDVIFLNHGSFGACPNAVFAEYQRWQLRLERQPVDFFMRRLQGLLSDARGKLAEYLNAPADELAFVSNVTSGLSVALRSLRLDAGDEILTTNQEYGAVDRLMAFVAESTGAVIKRHPVSLPYTDDAAFVDAFLAAATPNTKVIVISHITSPTALIFPAAEVCRRARQLGILTVIDGAHAVGQLPLDLSAVGADIYAGNCHKWLCAPKGSGFLHVRRESHPLVEPLVISHGWRDGASLADLVEGQGTRDPAAWLAVPAAIDFQAAHDWHGVRRDCHQLALETQHRLCRRFGLPPLSREQFAQMVTILLPACDAADMQGRLLADYGIEAPIGSMAGHCGIRLSFQAYNTPADADAVVDALTQLLA